MFDPLRSFKNTTPSRGSLTPGKEHKHSVWGLAEKITAPARAGQFVTWALNDFPRSLWSRQKERRLALTCRCAWLQNEGWKQHFPPVQPKIQAKGTPRAPHCDISRCLQPGKMLPWEPELTLMSLGALAFFLTYVKKPAVMNKS